MMHNLTKLGGSFKGTIAECMFKLVNPYLILQRFHKKEKFLLGLGKNLNREQWDFIYKNWFTIDGYEINLGKNVPPILYEIKTENSRYKNHHTWPLRMTRNQIDVYKEGNRLGFQIKLAIVWIYNNWNFDIEIHDFFRFPWALAKPRNFDKVPTMQSK